MRPVVGMFVNQGQIQFLHSQKTSRKSATISRAAQIAKTTFYLFCISDVDLDKKEIQGIYFDETKQLWIKKIFPYPDILYMRMGSPRKSRDKYNYFLSQLEESGVKKINGPAFNKWKVINVLKTNNNLIPHLPPTTLFESIGDIESMINKYGELYLKACRGRKGQEVLKIKALPKKRYEYRFFRHNQLEKGSVNLSSLTKRIKKFFHSKSFIIQKAIDLPRINGSICDMRAEVQRNGKGDLDIVEVLVRVSRPGAPITQHASSHLLEEFLLEMGIYLPKEIATIKSNIKKFLSEVYTTVEKSYGPYGEMGIDFALDSKGHLWFIECNSRPAKVSLIKAANPETILRAYLNILEYAKFIYQKGNS